MTFPLRVPGDTVEVCLPDSLRLVDWSVWRLVPVGGDASQGLGWPAECFLDVLALQLPVGGERTVTVPLGVHNAVLRVGLAPLAFDVPRPMLSTGGAGALGDVGRALPGSVGGGEVAGLLVHALAVHAPGVTRCLLFGGPQAPTLLEPVPHHSSRAFVAAEPDARGRLLVHAVLPEHGVSARAEAVVSDGPLQLHFKFQTAAGEVHAGALVTCARWPQAARRAAVVPVGLEVLRTLPDGGARIPEELVAPLMPVSFRLGREPGRFFEWDEGAGDEGLLPLVCSDLGFGELEVHLRIHYVYIYIYIYNTYT